MISGKYLLGIVVVVFFLYYVVSSRCSSYSAQQLLTGFWIADPTFAEDSGLDSFLFYISDFSFGSWESRSCYLVAESDGNLIINEPCTAYISETWDAGNWSSVGGLGKKVYSITFEDIETENIPHEQTLTLYPQSGKLVLSKGDTVYGVFFRDSEMTSDLYKTKKVEVEEVEDDESHESHES